MQLLPLAENVAIAVWEMIVNCDVHDPRQTVWHDSGSQWMIVAASTCFCVEVTILDRIVVHSVAPIQGRECVLRRAFL
jgi:hypothetical protein